MNGPHIKKSIGIIAAQWVVLCFSAQSGGMFLINSPDIHPVIVIDAQEPELIRISADLLARDIERVTGYLPRITQLFPEMSGPVILVGTVGSRLIRERTGEEDKDLTESLAGQWERYAHRFQTAPDGQQPVLMICGSDPRGTAYGVFHLSREIGVSPWIWWADVRPEQKDTLAVPAADHLSKAPSVQYRGIFLNDEDWGLQPWAAQSFEPETGDIGPKTYAKIFELLLRLNANYIWPAMHHCTRAFFHYPGNPEMARKYQIVIGSSHAEPMLRNNVDEWDGRTMGQFNFRTNRERVTAYWTERVKQSRANEAVYTVGMRGIHDSGMEGYENMDARVDALQAIVDEQRKILAAYLNPDVSSVPQTFTPYKEVLDIYDHGLRLPGDIAIVWTDDNYGYIRRLSGPEERQRPGGSGVYYHISYWGRPHDYLWLSSTHPVLIWEEMTKAYACGARRLWIVNVGDIKPAEYNMQLFLDMAYDIDAFPNSESVWTHHEKWAETIGPGSGREITELFRIYYQLCFERRPEFMGWNQVEDKTIVSPSDFNHWVYNDEAQIRLDAFEAISDRVNALKNRIPDRLHDAFFQCVAYPVKCASWMNAKFLNLEKAYQVERQGRLSANEYVRRSRAAYDSIVYITDVYNHRMAGGKWEGMMSMNPRQLPVFDMPPEPAWKFHENAPFGIAREGFDDEAYQNDRAWPLPVFYERQKSRHFIDIYLKEETPVEWTVSASVPWIRLSESGGTLMNQDKSRERRIWVSVDWNQVPEPKTNRGELRITGSGLMYRVSVTAMRLSDSALASNADFFELNNKVSIWAENPSRMHNGWKRISGLGYTGGSLISDYGLSDTLCTSGGGCTAEYDFYSGAGECLVRVVCIPTHPLYNEGLKLAVSVDRLDEKILDFRTVGRSAEWKQNVLSNQTGKTAAFVLPDAGRHTLYVRALSPAVIMDRIEIDFGQCPPSVTAVPETRFHLYEPDSAGADNVH
ncbi:glycosyl hydrolase 115 family protein [bacterium]|nr:glycosyl hydrolase 115 family protein [bacterium]